jgi:hypothetical protein
VIKTPHFVLPTFELMAFGFTAVTAVRAKAVSAEVASGEWAVLSPRPSPTPVRYCPPAMPTGACCSNFDWIMCFGTAPMI